MKMSKNIYINKTIATVVISRLRISNNGLSKGDIRPLYILFWKLKAKNYYQANFSNQCIF